MTVENNLKVFSSKHANNIMNMINVKKNNCHMIIQKKYHIYETARLTDDFFCESPILSYKSNLYSINTT